MRTKINSYIKNEAVNLAVSIEQTIFSRSSMFSESENGLDEKSQDAFLNLKIAVSTFRLTVANQPE